MELASTASGTVNASDTQCHFTRMIRWHWNVPFSGGGTMPEFTTVSVTEAKLQTTSGRQKTFLDDYVTYIQQLPKGQAGRLRIKEQENALTIRRRLGVAAQTLDINLIIKRSGNDVYFWREDRGDEQPRAKRRYTRRSRSQDEITAPDQPVDELGMVEQGIPEEESPE
jgi:hypothetical protein